MLRGKVLQSVRLDNKVIASCLSENSTPCLLFSDNENTFLIELTKDDLIVLLELISYMLLKLSEHDGK